MDGFCIRGRDENNVKYTDDTVLITDSVEKLQALVDVVNRDSEEKGLKINRENTECIVVSKRSETPVCLYK